MDAHRNHDSQPQGRRAPHLRDYAGLALVLGWLGAVTFGSVRMLAYGATPGTTAMAPSAWPGESSLPAPDGRPQLLVFLHPQCPCSRATLSELARLLSESAAAPRVLALVLAPRAAADGWLDTDLVRSARALAGVEVRADADGLEAGLFGAEVSGQALLYGDDGRLLFSGGLTPGRGHEGQNPGRVALATLLAGRAPQIEHAPVFGCALASPADELLGSGAP